MIHSFDRLAQAGTVRMQRQRRGEGRARIFHPSYLLENHAQSRQCTEMLRVAREHFFDIRHGKAQPIGHEPGGGARVPGFGEIGRMVDHGAEMGDGGVGLALAQGFLPALKQIIRHGRARSAPFALDLTLDSHPPLLIGARKFGHQGIKIGGRHVLRLRTRPQRQDRQSCRHDKIENWAPIGHNSKITRARKNARGRTGTKPRNAITSRTDKAMSNVIEQGVEALNEKLGGEGFDGTAKFVIEGEGEIVLDAEGARIGDDDTDVTLTASADTFRGMMEGNVNPTMAFMSGQLKIDGDMSVAMKLAAVMS